MTTESLEWASLTADFVLSGYVLCVEATEVSKVFIVSQSEWRKNKLFGNLTLVLLQIFVGKILKQRMNQLFLMNLYTLLGFH